MDLPARVRLRTFRHTKPLIFRYNGGAYRFSVEIHLNFRTVNLAVMARPTGWRPRPTRSKRYFSFAKPTGPGPLNMTPVPQFRHSCERAGAFSFEEPPTMTNNAPPRARIIPSRRYARFTPLGLLSFSALALAAGAAMGLLLGGL